jgi:hypothetical protein
MATTISAEIPFVDLKVQYATIREEVLAELTDVLEGMQLFLGPRQRAFEANFAAYCDATDCISMSNGTDALELALRALDSGKALGTYLQSGKHAIARTEIGRGNQCGAARNGVSPTTGMRPGQAIARR